MVGRALARPAHVAAQQKVLGVLLLVPVGLVVVEGEPVGVVQLAPGAVQGEVANTLVRQKTHVHLQQ